MGLMFNSNGSLSQLFESSHKFVVHRCMARSSRVYSLLRSSSSSRGSDAVSVLRIPKYSHTHYGSSDIIFAKSELCQETQSCLL
jgi:hypothetical protein